ncbi:MAG: hypothetical protein IPJ88_15435 [Myxococcales bacterium]|nr:MAG: hypothetical protein IPJ88_15435 [Myxococcales bacterium]
MTNRITLSIVFGFSLLALLAHSYSYSSHAKACSVAAGPNSELALALDRLADSLEQDFADVPLEISREGVLAFGLDPSTDGYTTGVFEKETEALGFAQEVDWFSILVLDPEGNIVLGKSEYRSEVRAVVWRANTELLPDTLYDVSLNILYTTNGESASGSVNRQVEFQLKSASDYTPEPRPIQTLALSIEAQKKVLESVCCDTSQPSPRDPYNCVGLTETVTRCWATQSTAIPLVRVQWDTVEQDLNRFYYAYRITSDASEPAFPDLLSSRDMVETRMDAIAFQEISKEYCLAIETYSLIDGTLATSQTLCVDHDPSIEAKEFPAQHPDFSSCFPYYEDSKEALTEDERLRLDPNAQLDPSHEGCSLKSSSPPRIAWLFVIGVFLWRRRRARQSFQ